MRRLENLQESIQHLQGDEVEAWNNLQQRQSMLRENIVLRDTLRRNSNENNNLEKQLNKSLKMNHEWEEYDESNKLELLEAENYRLRGKLDQIVSILNSKANSIKERHLF